MARLIASSEAEGIWTLQAGIFPENTASIELHTKSWVPSCGHTFSTWLHEWTMA